MRDSFKSILIPVDFSINTEVAVKKTLEITGSDSATVHLLHVNTVKNRNENPEQKKIEKMLGEWKKSIEETMSSSIVESEIVFSNSVQQSIIERAIEWQTDLIVIGQKSNHYWFPFLNTVIPVDVAEQTGNAVLTVKPGALHNKIRTLVMPVSHNVPSHKMDAIAALCKKFKLKIHLVTFMENNNSPSEFSAFSLLKVYQWLKDSMHCPVEYAVLHGYNKARALLDYSKKVDADILLVNTNSETKIGAFNRHISNVLPPASRMQVLTIQTEIN
jgi:nucleotide-binding universal stress UspA family protein